MNSRKPFELPTVVSLFVESADSERGAIKSAQRDGQVAVRPENVRRLKAVADFGEPARKEQFINNCAAAIN